MEQRIIRDLGLYLGCGVLAQTRNEQNCSKHLFQQAGIPQVPFVPYVKADFEESPEATSRNRRNFTLSSVRETANIGSQCPGFSKATNREKN